MALPALFHECSIAANIIGIPSAILLFVISPCSILFLLLLVDTQKVILMARSPLLIGSKFPLSAAFLAPAGRLSFFAARIRNEQTETIRASPPLIWHNGSSPGLHLVWSIQDGVGTTRAGENKEREWRRIWEKLFIRISNWSIAEKPCRLPISFYLKDWPVIRRLRSFSIDSYSLFPILLIINKYKIYETIYHISLTNSSGNLISKLIIVPLRLTSPWWRGVKWVSSPAHLLVPA